MTPAQMTPNQVAPASIPPQAVSGDSKQPVVEQLVKREKSGVLPEAAPNAGRQPVIEQLIEGEPLVPKGKSKRKLPRSEHNED
jgi:hypothetical protein